MGYDRYSLICRQDDLWNFKKGLISILVSWVLSFCFASPQLAIFKIESIVVKNTTINTCYAYWPSEIHEIAYISYHACAQFIIPLFTIIFLYVKIYRAISHHYNSSKNSKQEQSPTLDSLISDKSRSKSTSSTNSVNSSKAALKMTFVIVCAFIICSVPFYIGVFVNLFFRDKLETYKIIMIKVISKSLS